MSNEEREIPEWNRYERAWTAWLAAIDLFRGEPSAKNRAAADKCAAYLEPLLEALTRANHKRR